VQVAPKPKKVEASGGMSAVMKVLQMRQDIAGDSSDDDSDSDFDD